MHTGGSYRMFLDMPSSNVVNILWPFEIQQEVFMSVSVFPPKWPGNMAIIIGRVCGIKGATV